MALYSDNDVAIRVEELGKRYRLGQTVDFSRTLAETLAGLPRVLAGRARRAMSDLVVRDSANTVAYDPDTPPGTIWALRDVSFEVKRGEVIGIIGRNGAGKSTLLKILARITAPTRGRAEVRGRVGSLLEVGTGFHSELTGRENIYLNGSILGMRKAEIDRKFEEIVEFAEVGKFLDTPVKRYSSGMQVRLAFAVAAHLEPEILIVDEVLAVGDAQFQQKCLGRMENVAGEGRTILFVSHNMQAVKRLCPRGILLLEGRIAAEADAPSVIDIYMRDSHQQDVNLNIDPQMHWTYPPDLEVYRVEILNDKGEPTSALAMDETFVLRLHYKINNPAQSYRVGAVFWSADGTRLGMTVHSHNGLPYVKGQKGVPYQISARIRNVFAPGVYHMDINTKTAANAAVDSIRGIRFSVLPVSTEDGERGGGGLVCLDVQWSEPELAG